MDRIYVPPMTLDHLHSRILSCRLCDLALERTNAVPGEGPCPTQIMLIGEAPGADEDKTGRPFVGRCGRLLDRSLALAGIKRSEVFITSVVKCRPPGNRKPKKVETNACLPYLQLQIEMIRPQIICLMGNAAVQTLIKKQGVTSLHGQIFEDRFLVTFHPAAVLRNRNLQMDFISDLKKLKEMGSDREKLLHF
jgi:uracil-DNA glycosylase family 4